jgi:hypothetical protein
MHRSLNVLSTHRSGKTLASLAAGDGAAPLDKYEECYNAWAECNRNVSAKEVESKTDEWLKSKGMPLGLRLRMRPDLPAGAPNKIRDFLAAVRTQTGTATGLLHGQLESKEPKQVSTLDLFHFALLKVSALDLLHFALPAID